MDESISSGWGRALAAPVISVGRKEKSMAEYFMFFGYSALALAYLIHLIGR